MMSFAVKYQRWAMALFAMLIVWSPRVQARLHPLTSYEGVAFTLARPMALITAHAQGGRLTHRHAVALAFGIILAKNADFTVNLPLFAYAKDPQMLLKIEEAIIEQTFQDLCNSGSLLPGSPPRQERLERLAQSVRDLALNLGIDGFLQAILLAFPRYYGREKAYIKTLFAPKDLAHGADLPTH